MRLSTRIGAGTAAALVVVAIIAAVSWVGARQLGATTMSVDRSNITLRALDDTLAALVDVETGARGFALTGSEDFLRPYELGRKAAAPLLEQLRASLRAPGELEVMDRLEEAARARIEASDDVIATRRAGNIHDAAARVEMGAGKLHMERVRAAVAELRAVEEERLWAELTRAQRDARSALVFIVLTTGGLIALVALGAWSLARSISRPLASLMRATRRVARGEPAALEPTRDDELGELTRSFAAMAEERQRSEAQVRDLIEQAADAIFLADREGLILDVNAAGCALLDRAREAIVGHPIVELLVPEDAPRVAALHAALRPGATDLSHWRLRRDDGALDVEVSSTIVSGDRWQLVARDIRDRIAIEAERTRVLEAERHLRQRLETIRASALAISELGPARAGGASALQTIVDHARQLLDADHAALGIGTDPDVPFDPWVWSGVDDEVARRLPHGPRPHGVLGRVALRDEPLRLAARDEHPESVPLPGGHPAMAAFLGVPIRFHGRAVGNLYLTRAPGRASVTAEDQAALELLASHAAIAIENSRLFDEVVAAVHARDELLAVVSHDLKNPLNAIAIHEQLLARLHSEPELRDHAQVVRRAVASMQRMIRSLLDMASLDAGKLRLDVAEQPLDKVVDEVIDVFVPIAADRGVRLACELPPLPPVPVDRERLIQVLHNLIGNGLKHTHAGAVTISARRQNGEVEVTVADTGTGISADDLPHVFDRFYTTSRGHQGTGLGLHIARRLVEAHGGRIWAESVPGTGTVVTFALPLGPRHAPS